MCNVISPDGISDAIGAHKTWKQRLQNAILAGSCPISSAIARLDDQCEFGCWLHATCCPGKGINGVLFNEVKHLHAEFHRIAGGVLAYVERGNTGAALFLLDGEYRVVSEMLIEALTDWQIALEVCPDVPKPASEHAL